MEIEDSSSLDPHSTILVKLHPSFPKNVFREVPYAMIISVDLLNEEVNVEY